MANLTIVTSARTAFARALANETVYLVVGSGDSAWDSANPIPQPGLGQTTLLNELARVVATVEYLDPTGAVSGSPTNRLRFSGTFGIGVANGTIREYGIMAFGTGTANSGVLIGAINITAINKPSGGSDFSLARYVRLTF
jgi:hypothetical protein